MRRSVILLSGFKRTGKDTFYNQIQGNLNEKYNWHIYANRKNTNNSQFIELLQNKSNFVRFGFADELKKEVCNHYNINEINEYNKDTYSNIYSRTYRELLIDYAAKKREQNVNYWCSIVSNKITRFIKYGFNNFMITDFRYPNEYQYISENNKINTDDIFTVRLFRDYIDIPNISDLSERSLDDFNFDYILVDHRGSFEYYCRNVNPNAKNGYVELDTI